MSAGTTTIVCTDCRKEFVVCSSYRVIFVDSPEDFDEQVRKYPESNDPTLPFNVWVREILVEHAGHNKFFTYSDSPHHSEVGDDLWWFPYMYDDGEAHMVAEGYKHYEREDRHHDTY